MLAAATKFFARLLDGVQIWKWPPFITFGATSYEVSGPEMRVVLDTVQGGDLVLRRYCHYVTSLLIPGYYSHVGVVRNQSSIIHAVHEGVVQEDILTYLRTDHVLVLRPREGRWKDQAVDRALEMHGRPYDFAFETADKSALYCTELALYCYSEIVPDRTEMKKRVPPDELLDLRTFDVVFDSKEYRNARRKNKQ